MAKFIYNGTPYWKGHKNQLKCVGYVNYWHKKHKLPLPHPKIKPVEPSSTQPEGKVNTLANIYNVNLSTIFENEYKYVYKLRKVYQAQFRHNNISYTKQDRNKLRCVGYVNYWHRKHNLPLPHPKFKAIKPPSTLVIFGVKIS